MLFLIVVSIVLSISIILIVNTLLHSHRSKPNYPPGKTGWPIIGEGYEFATRPDKFIRDRMSTRSPDVFQTSIMGEKMAIFCGASANKFIYSNEGKLFGPWIPASLSNVFEFNNLIFYDKFHKWLRIDSLKNYVPIIDPIIQAHLEAHWAPFDEVKAYKLIRDLVFNVVCYIFIGHQATKEEVSQLAETFIEFNDGLMSVPVNIPGTTFHRAMKAASVTKRTLIEHTKTRKIEVRNNKSSEIVDFLGQTLMGMMENGENDIKEEEIANKIIAFLFASFHSTSTTITILVYHLARHPQVYDKVLQEQLEILESKKEGELLNWTDIQKMKYTWNAILESIRLKPSSLGGFRVAITDFTYKGYTIPKGWKIHWSNFSTNMDPNVFPDPEKYDPDRFGGSKLASYTFVPFGGGPKICCGRELARILTLIFVHNLVTRFKFNMTNPNEKIVYNPAPHPVDGLGINLQPRGI